jgi:hypothetical protein
MMKKSVKAALWSGLGFPGVGQLVLKHHGRALFYIVPSAICFFWYLRGLIIKMQMIMDQILSGAVTLDPAAITEMVNNMPSSTSEDIAFWGFTVCWVVSIIDAFQLGLNQEANDAAVVKRPGLE